jgi:DNA-binding MarR family transcriptional regulator
MKLERNEQRNIEVLIGILEQFRKMDQEIPIQYVVSFLHIALEQGLAIQDLQTKIDMSQSATSRNVAALSDWFKPKENKRGHGLVKSHEDLMDRRKKTVELTLKGHALLREINSQLAKANQ